MRIYAGERVRHPVSARMGEVQEVHENPACLMRTLLIQWDDGELEELEELEFGPLED